MSGDDLWKAPTAALGEYLRGQRKLAELSLRELADRTKVSNAYLSQIERGLHQPSVRVLRSLADALDIPADRLFARAGDAEESDTTDSGPDVESAIRAEDRLSEAQKQALISVFRSYLAAG